MRFAEKSGLQCRAGDRGDELGAALPVDAGPDADLARAGVRHGGAQIGATEFRVAVTHLLPNAIPPMIMALTLGDSRGHLCRGWSQFLGIGINEPVPSLGKMVADSRQYIQLYWHLGLFPSLAIALAVLGFAFLGDGLRDAWTRARYKDRRPMVVDQYERMR